MKIHKFRMIYVCALLGMNLIFSVLFISRMPETVPTHFSLDWVCDSTGSRWTGLLPALMPIISIIPLLFTALCDEKNRNVISIISIFLMLYLIADSWLLLFAMNSGAHIGEKIAMPYVWILMLAFSASFAGIGNYLPTVGKNKLLGIRTKYTMQSDRCWKLTHRFAGQLWVVTGIVWTVINIFGLISNADSIAAFCILFIFIMIDILIPCVYSYKNKNV